MRRILIVEDEIGLVVPLADRLRAEGYDVEAAMDGQTGLQRGLTNTFDLILLDLMLPKLSGMQICKQLRQQEIGAPILMLTARSQVTDKVAGLQSGADDYLTKPFDMRELLARVAAMLRRHQTKSGEPLTTYTFGDVQVDMQRSAVVRSGEAVSLSTKEFQLLRHLIERRGVILSREQLLGDVWGYETATLTRTVDVHIAWLRQKLEPNPRSPEFFLTVRGTGYKFAG
ncbi:MAG: response regulator transcription factor [Acidobacteria bacterium]|nr:response regulator transcription factor [Acidobacteriota bacterium]